VGVVADQNLHVERVIVYAADFIGGRWLRCQKKGEQF
jgi:hypothetical protein